MRQTPPPDNGHPSHLLDVLIYELGLRNDAGLARAFEFSPSVISKIRRGRVGMNAELLLRIHDATGKSIRELRNLMGDTSPKYWPMQSKPAPKTPHQMVTSWRQQNQSLSASQ